MKSEKNNLRSFIYLHDYKLTSLISQMNEGVTDHYLHQTQIGGEKHTDQKGPPLRGQSAGYSQTHVESTMEKKSIGDYYWSQFERDLISQEKIKVHGVNFFNSSDICIGDIVKFSGNISFTDNLALLDLVKNFNQLGNACATLEVSELGDDVMDLFPNQDVIKKLNIQSKNKNKVNVDGNLFDVSTAIAYICHKKGLSFSPDFLSAVNTLMSRGYGESIIARMLLNENALVIESTLDRKYLRDEINSIGQKYGLYTQAKLNLVGIVSQNGMMNHDETPEHPNPVKQAMLSLSDGFLRISNMFSAATEGEVFLDCLSIYMDL